MAQTLQCPKCSKAVSVGDQSAGKRVRCPHCSKEFLAPGFAASSNDDDDWLQLDDDSPTAPIQNPASQNPLQNSPPASAKPEPGVDQLDDVFDEPAAAPDAKTRPAKPKSNKPVEPPADELPSLADADIGDLEPLPPRKSGAAAAAGLDMFGDALDEFTSGVEPLPSTAPANSDDVFGDLPPVELPKPSAANHDVPSAEDPSAEAPFGAGDAFDTPPAAASIPSADAVEYQQEFRIKCHICNSLLYAKAKQQGRKIKCHDCHTEIVVPAPPRVKKKPTIDIERAATFSFEESANVPKNKRPDPYRKSAEELLNDASKVEETVPVHDYSTPDIKEWAQNTFGVLLDPKVILHWGGISLLAVIPAAIVLWTESPLLAIGLFVGGLVLAAVVASCGLAILQAVANQHKMVTEWPTSGPTDWFDDLVFVLSAAALVAVPAWALAMVVFKVSLISAAITMFAIFSLFPFVILSMLDMRSIFVPFSAEVARSVTRCQEAWGVLYFSSGLMFFALFLLFSLMSAGGNTILMASLGIPATVGVAFCYFALIGRLAYAIGQTINEPPKKRAASEGQVTQ